MAVPGEWWIPNGDFISTPDSGQPPLGAVPYVLPTATVGVPYSIDIYTPNGAANPAVLFGSWLPTTPAELLACGVSIDPTGPIPNPDFGNILAPSKDWESIWKIFGTPLIPGTYLFFLTLENDDFSPFSQRVFQLNIVAAPSKKRKIISAPETICCDPNSFERGICPPAVKHTSGYYYDRIGKTNCYILRKTR